MTITVKNVFCGGALITSDDIPCQWDNEFDGCQATVISGIDAGRSVPIFRSKRLGAITVGTSRAECLVDHRDDCEGTTYCDCPDCAGHECGCELKYSEARFAPAPLSGLAPGDKIHIAGMW